MAKLARLCAISLISLLAHSNPTLAKAWQTLPDGRVLIDIKGEKLAFDPGIADAARGYAAVVFSARGADEHYSLSQVLADPERSRTLFSKYDPISVVMVNSQNLSRQFLNRFPRDSLPSSSRIELLIFGGQESEWRGCDPHHFYRGIPNVGCDEAKLFSYESLTPDADGFLRVVSLSAQARRTNAQYVLSRAIREKYADGPVIFGCSEDFTPRPLEWGKCEAYSSISNRLRVFYEFQFARYPKSSWLALDHRMRTIFANILGEKSSGR
jgi:hypothetical protein